MGSQHNKKKGRDGFTIVELMIVLVILAILASIAIPQYLTYLDKARLTASISTLSSLGNDMEAYRTDNGHYPVSIDWATYTDQNGNSILTAMTPSTFYGKIASWQTYSSLNDTYAITATANDNKQTLLTLSPTGVATN
jgi:type II secretion system protein G